MHEVTNGLKQRTHCGQKAAGFLHLTTPALWKCHTAAQQTTIYCKTLRFSAAFISQFLRETKTQN